MKSEIKTENELEDIIKRYKTKSRTKLRSTGSEETQHLTVEI